MNAAHPNLPIAIIEAPISLGLRPPSEGRIPGTRRMPRALVDAGLLNNVPLASHTALAEPAYSPEIGPSGVRNLDAIIHVARILADCVGKALEARQRPVILGGDCSVLLGPAVALKRIGRFALLHIDGHNDFGHAGNWGVPYPSIAGADLAVVTGRGPEALTQLDGLGPYFRDEDVYQFGEKGDEADPGYEPRDFPKTAIHRTPLSALRRIGVEAAAQEAMEQMAASRVEGYWVHVDVDVLDSKLMPAVDSPEPLGLDWVEFEALLKRVWASPQCVGMNIGIYDPDLDPSGIHAGRLVAVLRGLLGAPDSTRL